MAFLIIASVSALEVGETEIVFPDADNPNLCFSYFLQEINGDVVLVVDQLESCPGEKSSDFGQDDYKYEFIDDNCLKITVEAINPEPVLVFEEVSDSYCDINPYTSDNPSTGTVVYKKSKKKSIVVVEEDDYEAPPLNLPDSNAVFNEVYCNQQAIKQKCVDGYRTFNCEAYNVVGEFKDFKVGCVSCANEKQDHNEQGVDCGGVCSKTCPVVLEPEPEPEEPAVVEKPAVAAWVIPAIVIASIILLLLIFVLIGYLVSRRNVEGDEPKIEKVTTNKKKK